MTLPRSLNNALQARLKDWGIPMAEVRAVPRLIEEYLSGVKKRELLVAGLAQAFRRKNTRIPRKGARMGHDQIPSPDIQMAWLIEDVMAIVESAKSPTTPRNTLTQRTAARNLQPNPDPHP